MTDASGVVLGGLDRNKEKLRHVRNLLFSACGTSLYASQYGAKLMRDMGAVDTCFAQVCIRSGAEYSICMADHSILNRNLAPNGKHVNNKIV